VDSSSLKGKLFIIGSHRQIAGAPSTRSARFNNSNRRAEQVLGAPFLSRNRGITATKAP